MAGVIHIHPENLPHLGQRRPVDRFLNPAGAIDRSWVAGSASTANTVAAGTATVRVALTFVRGRPGRSVVGFAGAAVVLDTGASGG